MLILSVFLCILIIQSVLAYYLCRDILSPWFITSTLFSFVTIILYFNINKWGVTFYPDTALLISLSIICMGIGELIAQNSVGLKIKNNSASAYGFRYIDLPTWFLISVFLFGIFICYRNYSYIISISSRLNFGYSLLWKARSIMLTKDFKYNKVLAIFGFLVRGMSYSLIYVLINNFFSNKIRAKQKLLWHLLAILPILGIEVLSTGRTGIIQLFVICAFLYFIAWNIKHYNKCYSFVKAFICSFIILFLFYAVFQLLGLLTGKTQSSSTFDTLSIYTASGLAALNNWLLDATVETNIFGGETFFSLYELFYKIGLTNIKGEYIQPFIYFSNGYSTNIYTAFMHYYRDFGGWGCLFIYFLQGYLFSFLYYRIKKRGVYGLCVIIYSYLAYDLFRQIAAASFIRVYLSVSFVMRLISIIFSYYIIKYVSIQNTVKDS